MSGYDVQTSKPSGEYVGISGHVCLKAAIVHNVNGESGTES